MSSNLDKLFVDVNNWITPSLESAFVEEDYTVEASKYSLLAGGKRIRPCFMYVIGQMLDANLYDIRVFATALEMIHTYSLIHDDLPCMDDDELRRGKPTCHIAYGENYAVLAGDALLNKAYEILLKHLITNPSHSYAASELARAAGASGMIGGQTIDLQSEGKKISSTLLNELHEKKTGALIWASICVPYLIKYSNEDYVETIKNRDYIKLQKLSNLVGLAFQIKDDILDVTASTDKLGKSVGKDERDFKSTFVTLYGLEEAKKLLDSCLDDINSIIEELSENFGYNTDMLSALVDFVVKRDY